MTETILAVVADLALFVSVAALVVSGKISPPDWSSSSSRGHR